MRQLAWLSLTDIHLSMVKDRTVNSVKSVQLNVTNTQTNNWTEKFLKKLWTLPTQLPPSLPEEKRVFTLNIGYCKINPKKCYSCWQWFIMITVVTILPVSCENYKLCIKNSFTISSRGLRCHVSILCFYEICDVTKTLNFQLQSRVFKPKWKSVEAWVSTLHSVG